MHVIDTNVAIYLRDGNRAMLALVAELPMAPAISIMTWAELEGGVYSQASDVDRRRSSLDALLTRLKILPFDQPVVQAYGEIVAARGFIRSRIFDRLIAASAIVNDLTLITINGPDFRDIPDLKLEIWPTPQ